MRVIWKSINTENMYLCRWTHVCMCVHACMYIYLHEGRHVLQGKTWCQWCTKIIVCIDLLIFLCGKIGFKRLASSKQLTRLLWYFNNKKLIWIQSFSLVVFVYKTQVEYTLSIQAKNMNAFYWMSGWIHAMQVFPCC